MFNHGGLKPTSPFVSPQSQNRTQAPDSAVSSSATPNFVVYTDKWTSIIGPPPVSEVEGFNVLYVLKIYPKDERVKTFDSALAFVLVNGAFDKAQEWASMSPAQRAATKAHYHNAGIKLVVSAFGSTDTPTTNGADPIATANNMANFVIDYGLDGIDVDYEDFQAINAGNGEGEAWIINFTKQLRTRLPKGKYILTHAPVAPWFSPGRFSGGAYVKVNKEVGDLIDWYNIQFYNQGSTDYTTCEGLLYQSSSSWPETAVFEMARNGVDLHKIVIGKPGNNDDASNGYMSTSMLSSCLEKAAAHGWRGGAMTWEYPDANSTWIRHVRRQAFPESTNS
ncbi:hypothetical protein Clacol_004947 [Clathrus columnatus]|uniref:GH18 domain-containing protein n=1 Tax=Clathrus columnatus TaxID=1419009 RepID=A0AAV5AFK1_9AGAM|nr:hypothetical protein Clacol_004947 [Clathrus columnatus]